LFNQVDIPPPFSFVPMPVLSATANTALTASLSLIIVSPGSLFDLIAVQSQFCPSLAIVQNSFVTRLAQDYAVWASNPELRKRRLQAEIASGTSMVEL
jgi:hypothetical protein